jgi:hypothetical protein
VQSHITHHFPGHYMPKRRVNDLNTIAHHGILDHGVLFIQKPFSASDLALKARQALD